MRHHEGGSKVHGGFYFHRSNWELVTVSGTKGVLPGTSSDDYLKVPTLLMLAGAPVLGGAFVIFLPLIGFGMLGAALARKVARPFTAVQPAEAPSKSR